MSLAYVITVFAMIVLGAVGSYFRILNSLKADHRTRFNYPNILRKDSTIVVDVLLDLKPYNLLLNKID